MKTTSMTALASILPLLAATIVIQKSTDMVSHKYQLLAIVALISYGAIQVSLLLGKGKPRPIAFFYTVLIFSVVVSMFATLHAELGIFFSGNSEISGSKVTDIGSAFYFSLVTITTLGYGDFQPHPDLRLLAAYQGCLGYVILGVFVSQIIEK